MYTYVICSSGAQGVRLFFSSRRIGSFFFLRVLAGMSKAHSLGTNTSLVRHGGGVFALSLSLYLYIYVPIYLYLYLYIYIYITV